MVCLTATVHGSFPTEVKDFFNKLKEIIEIVKLKSVVRLAKGVELTFVSEAALKEFLEKAPQEWEVKSQLKGELLITISPRFGEGHSLVADSVLYQVVSKHGEIKKGRRLYFDDYPTIENGIRQFVIVPKKDAKIPGMISLGRAGFRVSYRGQVKSCHRCNSSSHEVKECTAKVCFRCQQFGHEKSECTSKLICTACQQVGHSFARCPESYALKLKLGKNWSTATRKTDDNDKEQKMQKENETMDKDAKTDEQSNSSIEVASKPEKTDDMETDATYVTTEQTLGNPDGPTTTSVILSSSSEFTTDDEATEQAYQELGRFKGKRLVGKQIPSHRPMPGQNTRSAAKRPKRVKNQQF